MQNNLGQVVCENHAEMTYEELIVFAEEYAKKLKGIKCCAILCNCEMAASVALFKLFAAGVTGAAVVPEIRQTSLQQDFRNN